MGTRLVSAKETRLERFLEALAAFDEAANDMGNALLGLDEETASRINNSIQFLGLDSPEFWHKLNSARDIAKAEYDKEVRESTVFEGQAERELHRITANID